MVGNGEEILVGDGLLLGDTGIFNLFLVPSVGFFGTILSGDEEDAVITELVGGRVFNLMGTNALRTSSPFDSLPNSLGLFGGVLDGLLGMVAGVLLVVLVFAGRVAYSVGYMTGSNGYDGRTVGGKVGGIEIDPEEKQRNFTIILVTLLIKRDDRCISSLLSRCTCVVQIDRG